MRKCKLEAFSVMASDVQYVSTTYFHISHTGRMDHPVDRCFATSGRIFWLSCKLHQPGFAHTVFESLSHAIRLKSRYFSDTHTQKADTIPLLICLMGFWLIWL